MKKLLTAFLLVLSLTNQPAFAEKPSEDAKLPKVLIIGDSISLGYTPYVKNMLKDQAEVVHNRGNAGPTMRGVANIEKWLGDTPWDVIHFNWGLWDMYGWEYAKEDRSPARYAERLEALVARLKKTKAKLIWGTTTPACPEPEKTMLRRFKTKVVIVPQLEQQYLDAALEVMKKNKVEVNDLYAVVAPELKKYSPAADDVHYTKPGYEKLGEQVAKSIEAALKAEK